MAGNKDLRVCALYLVLCVPLQTQDVARAFEAVCTPEFFLYKKVVTMCPNFLCFLSMLPPVMA